MAPRQKLNLPHRNGHCCSLHSSFTQPTYSALVSVRKLFLRCSYSLLILWSPPCLRWPDCSHAPFRLGVRKERRFRFHPRSPTFSSAHRPSSDLTRTLCCSPPRLGQAGPHRPQNETARPHKTLGRDGDERTLHPLRGQIPALYPDAPSDVN
jgi:hypothetical protein